MMSRAGAVLAFCFAAALCTQRVTGWSPLPGQRSVAGYALQDFRDAIYYPVRDFLDGENPYDTPKYKTRQPVGQPFPLYSPATFVVHLPFALLPFRIARYAYLAWTIALTPVLAALALRLAGVRAGVTAAFAVAAATLLGRPGQMNTFVGQYTATMVLGVYLTLALLPRHPRAAGLGFALTTLKPTFGLPLLAYLALRRAWRTVIVGLAIGGAVAAVPAAVLIWRSGGLGPFLVSLETNQAHFAAEASVNPATSLYRIDLAGLLGHAFGHPLGFGDVLVTFAVLGVFAAGLTGLRPLTNAADRTEADALACIATLLAVYHQLYNAILLLLPIVVLVAGRSRATGASRWTLMALLLVPQVNYAASVTVVNRLAPGSAARLIATSANGLALVVALVLWLAIIARTPTTDTTPAPGLAKIDR